MPRFSRLTCALASATIILAAAGSALADAASIAAEHLVRITNHVESGGTVIANAADNAASRITTLDAQNAAPRALIGAGRAGQRVVGETAERTRRAILRDTRRALGMLSREDADQAIIDGVTDAAQAALQNVGDSAQAARQQIADALRTALADEQRPGNGGRPGSN